MGSMQTPTKPLFRFAHISDLHFSKLQWGPSQFFSKRWLGNLNVCLVRKTVHDPEGLTTLFPLFHERRVDAVLITGDLSSTSHPDEFALAKQFIEGLREEKFQVFTLPGNHDHYTKAAYRNKVFYDFFPSRYEEGAEFTLKDEGITTTYLGKHWWLCALDTALATSLISSQGFFSNELEAKLESTLKKIPTGDSVMLLNHFPFFSNESSRKALLRKEALRALLERFPQVKLFLHGHTHRHCIADLRASSLPIVLDSGSTSHKKGGSWNLIEISSQGCSVEAFKNSTEEGYSSWKPFSKSLFHW
jgi:3',5'-cyclic AMP phosphodiesterase CpdA